MAQSMLTISQLPDNPCKADELALWEEFLESLPANCYLALYFAGSRDLLANAMRDDMHCEPIQSIRRVRDEAAADCATMLKRVDELKRERDRLESEKNRAGMALLDLRGELADLRRAAQTLAGEAITACQKAGCK